MKKILTAIVFLYLFIYFLVYAGVFRNSKDPIKVAKFYFECMKDYEWMLTYPVTKPGYFDETKLIKDKERVFNRVKIKNMEFELLGIKENIAFLEARFICQDQQIVKSTLTLERNSQNQWLIKDVSYN